VDVDEEGDDEEGDVDVVPTLEDMDLTDPDLGDEDEDDVDVGGDVVAERHTPTLKIRQSNKLLLVMPEKEP